MNTIKNNESEEKEKERVSLQEAVLTFLIFVGLGAAITYDFIITQTNATMNSVGEGLIYSEIPFLAHLNQFLALTERAQSNIHLVNGAVVVALIIILIVIIFTLFRKYKTKREKLVVKEK